MELKDKEKEKAELIERIRNLMEPLTPISINHATKLQKLAGIKCVAFDFYGTMFISGVGDIGIDEDQKEESESIFRESITRAGLTIENQAAGRAGLQILKQTLNHYLKQAKEQGIANPEPEIREVWADTLTELTNRSLISGEVKRSTVVKFAIEFEFRVNAVWPVPNLADVLDKLKNMGIRLAIISNSQFYTPLAFEAAIGKSPESFGFDPDLLVWSFECKRKKPDIKFYEQFVERIQQKNLDPTEVLYVGNDIHKDIQPAKKLGIRTALFVGDSRSIRHEEAELEELTFPPDLIIDDLSQIIECLQLQP